jgi:hypothetical protein
MGRELTALPGARRSWVSFELPGYREPPGGFATYSDFSYEELPPIERALDDRLGWLIEQPEVKSSLAEQDRDPVRAATGEELEQVASGVKLPPAFAGFIASEEPRRRIRSCTDCYLDLGDFAVALDEGLLVHFLSDSQWVCHWLLYSGPDGEAVVVSYDPLGFELGEDEVTARKLSTATMDASVCAESFSEFLYRFWIENEIWFRLMRPGLLRRPGLTDEQRRYAEHYAT